MWFVLGSASVYTQGGLRHFGIMVSLQIIDNRPLESLS